MIRKINGQTDEQTEKFYSNNNGNIVTDYSNPHYKQVQQLPLPGMWQWGRGRRAGSRCPNLCFPPKKKSNTQHFSRIIYDACSNISCPCRKNLSFYYLPLPKFCCPHTKICGWPLPGSCCPSLPVLTKISDTPKMGLLLRLHSITDQRLILFNVILSVIKTKVIKTFSILKYGTDFDT